MSVFFDSFIQFYLVEISFVLVYFPNLLSKKRKLILCNMSEINSFCGDNSVLS